MTKRRGRKIDTIRGTGNHAGGTGERFGHDCEKLSRYEIRRSQHLLEVPQWQAGEIDNRADETDTDKFRLEDKEMKNDKKERIFAYRYYVNIPNNLHCIRIAAEMMLSVY